MHFLSFYIQLHTVAPELVATSIKQTPILSKHFYVPQLILHANERVLSKHAVLCGQWPLDSVPILSLSSHLYCQFCKNSSFDMGLSTLSSVKRVFHISSEANIHCLLFQKVIIDKLSGSYLTLIKPVKMSGT